MRGVLFFAEDVMLQTAAVEIASLAISGDTGRQARNKAGLSKNLVMYCSRHDYGTRLLRDTKDLSAVRAQPSFQFREAGSI